MKQIKRFCTLLLLLGFVGVVIFYFAATRRNMPAVYVSIGILLVSSVGYARLWRCPHCGKPLGRRGRQTFCSECGKNLDEER